jgi:hypothetical protein
LRIDFGARCIVAAAVTREIAALNSKKAQPREPAAP